MDVLKRLHSESVDLIIADPPYYHMRGEFDFVFQSVQEYLDWCSVWAAECCRILKPTGAFYCWGSSQMIDKLSVSVLDKLEWIKRNLIVWNYGTGRPEKQYTGMKRTFYGITASPSMRSGMTKSVFHTMPEGRRTRGKIQKENPAGNVWEYPRVMPNYKESTGHPTQKPEKLAERIILASSMPDDLVFIPFAGSGSEIVQCMKHGRNFIATEINTSYVRDIILPRIDITGKMLRK